MSVAARDIVGGAGAEFRYWAFISYSHRDSAWAQRLHSKLETWPVPKNLVGKPTPVTWFPTAHEPVAVSDPARDPGDRD